MGLYCPLRVRLASPVARARSADEQHVPIVRQDGEGRADVVRRRRRVHLEGDRRGDRRRVHRCSRTGWTRARSRRCTPHPTRTRRSTCSRASCWCDAEGEQSQRRAGRLLRRAAGRRRTPSWSSPRRARVPRGADAGNGRGLLPATPGSRGSRAEAARPADWDLLRSARTVPPGSRSSGRRRSTRTRLRSQMSRRPLRVSSSSISSIVSQNGTIARGEAAGGDRLGRLAELLAQARDDAVDLRGEAVDDAGADRVDGPLADQRCAAGRGRSSGSPPRARSAPPSRSRRRGR